MEFPLLLGIHGLTVGAIYALVALGFHLVFRATGVLDFGQGDKVLLGGLVGLSLVRVEASLPVVFAVVAVIGLLAGAVYDRLVIAPALRRGVGAAIVASVGALLVMSSGHVLIWGGEGKPFPALISGTVSILGGQASLHGFVVWVVVAAIVAIVYLFLTRTKYGKGLIAASTDPVAAGAVGINVVGTRVMASSAAFGLAALAGVLIAPITLAGGTFGGALTLKAFTGAIFGGLDSFGGVIFGAVLLGVIENVIGGYIPFAYREAFTLSLLIVTLLLFPQGIFGLRRRLA